MTKTTVKRTRMPVHETLSELRQYLWGYFADNNVAPTQLEIAEHFSSKRGGNYSTQWAGYMLRELEAAGIIKLIPNKHRGIEIVTSYGRKNRKL